MSWMDEIGKAKVRGEKEGETGTSWRVQSKGMRRLLYRTRGIKDVLFL